MSWIDRVVEFPYRVKLTAVSGQNNTYDMEAAEGTVYVEGTLLNAENLNRETTELINNAMTNVITETLLWTNPNPTASFAAQTVALNLNDYDEVKIEHFTVGSDYNNIINFIEKSAGKGSLSFPNIVMTTPSGTRGGNGKREVSITNTGLTFDAANKTVINSGVFSTIVDSLVCIPRRIWGIKKL